MNSTECVFLNMKKTAKTSLKRRLFLALFSLLFACSTLFLPLLNTPAYADPKPTTNTPSEVTSDQKTEETTNTEPKKEEKTKFTDEDLENVCNGQAGALGWLICPSSGAISKAVDSIYGTIEDFLVINPIPADDSSTIHIVWEYVRNITNIVFIIFLLVVVISHLTGFGINNYGLKRILPRIIVVGILVNLSFIICQIAIDVSNLLGYGLRDFFLSVEENAIMSGSIKAVTVTWTDLVNVVTGSAAAAGIGIALSGGLIAVFWTLVPVLLGAIISIAIGFITIAMRQALVAVLTMIAPLAFVCFLLPNTEKWFGKWKDTLFKMLVFYPMFSFLFGASHLAGWAIITSSVNENGETSGFGVLLGLAVQVFPLFFSWSLMKMSGTVLGTVNQKLHALSVKPLGAINRISQTNKGLAKSKYLATKPKGIGQDVIQRINDRQIRKEEDIAKYDAHAKLRGQAYAARMRNKKGNFTKRAGDFYEMQADSLNYQKQIERTKNDFNKGLGAIVEGEVARGRLGRGTLKSAGFLRLQQLDMKNVNASDTLKFEQARAEKIDYDNAVGFHDRVEQAFDAHIDQLEAGNPLHKRHEALGEGYGSLRASGLARYKAIEKIMEGDVVGSYYVKADAAHNYATHNKIVSGKFQTAFDLTPATQDVENQIRELTKLPDSTKHIDQIISGLRTINMRGDTDIVKHLIDDALIDHKIQVGTHASQSLANFLMFEVKDNDPMLRRFGKYINLETAGVYNNNDKHRQKLSIDYDEFITGEYLNPDGTKGYSKKSSVELMEGTSLDNVERTFYSNLDESVRKAYETVTIDENGKEHRFLTEEGKKAFLKKRKTIYNSMAPAFLSASLKYPSGSEQLVNAVSYLTGYKEKIAKDENGAPLRDENGLFLKTLEKRWEDKNDALYGLEDIEEGEGYFRTCAENYLTDQIPSQILNMRTDYRSTLTNHLFWSLMNSDEAERASAKKEFAEILGLDGLTDYQFDQITRGAEKIKEDDSKDARIIATNTDKNKRKKINDYMINKAGLTARKLWDKNGTLAQLYKSRRSGAANNAKPFVRNWANLDNEAEIQDYLKKQEQARKKKLETDPDASPATAYPEEERDFNIGLIDDVFDEHHDSADDFYNAAQATLEAIGVRSTIGEMFKDYYEASRTTSAKILLAHLRSLLNDPENYL